MRPRARLLAIGVLLAAGAGCGQQGPLVLPEDARPVERIDPGAPSESEQNDDERGNER
jgi:predicted small lipoprotein YifL